jgi:hypothetical protein
MVMTYNTLVNEITSYLNRNDADTLSNIPNFIYQAEQRICRESKNIGFEQYVVGNFIPGTSVYAKPGRWRRNITFNYGTGINNNTRNQVYLRSYEYVRAYWPDATQLGNPLYYCDYGFNNFLIAPTPIANYPFEYSYLELPQPLSINNQTNWLTNYASDALLFGCLLQAIPFLKDDERIPMWSQAYASAVASINEQGDQRVLDRTSNRTSD